MTTTRAEFEKKGLDPECIELVWAMNQMPGITTVESCCGHGKRPFTVFFTAESLNVLPDLLYWFDGCHSSVYGWRVEAYTDCSKAPVKFFATSTKVGDEAYNEANKIAGKIGL